MRTLHLNDVELLRVVSGTSWGPFDVVQVQLQQQREGGEEISSDHVSRTLTLQARSNRETRLWAQVLQENLRLLVGREVPMLVPNDSEEVSDCQKVRCGCPPSRPAPSDLDISIALVCLPAGRATVLSALRGGQGSSSDGEAGVALTAPMTRSHLCAGACWSY
jgi:hypothetical protein